MQWCILIRLIFSMSVEKEVIDVNRNKHGDAGPFAEAAAMGREAVENGVITAEQALRLSNAAYRDQMVNEVLGLPVERGSVQLPVPDRSPG